VKLSFVWASSTRDELRRLDRETGMRILLALTRYAETGEGDVKALEGKFTGAHRLRVGDWRVRFKRMQGGAILILAVKNHGHPASEWVVQQLREAFPDSGQYSYVILDRDTKFDAQVLNVLRSIGLTPKRTSRQSPWQNGVAERWVGSARRELLDLVIPLNEQHLRRLIRDHVCYNHTDRTRDGLGKETPNGRGV